MSRTSVNSLFAFSILAINSTIPVRRNSIGAIRNPISMKYRLSTRKWVTVKHWRNIQVMKTQACCCIHYNSNRRDPDPGTSSQSHSFRHTTTLTILCRRKRRTLCTSLLRSLNWQEAVGNEIRRTLSKRSQWLKRTRHASSLPLQTWTS